MAVTCPVDLDTRKLRDEIQSIYAQVAEDLRMRTWLALVAGTAALSACGSDGGGAADGGGADAAPACGMAGVVVAGSVSAEVGGAPIAGARVTLLSTDGAVFREARTDGAGRFGIAAPDGAYALGASAPSRAYVEVAIAVAGACVEEDLVLGSETERGRWDTVGDPGERLGGTNSGVLLADGRLMYCHDTLDPVILDPITEALDRPPESPRLQGCHAVSVMTDGRVLYVGGADVAVYGPGTRQVKTFDPIANEWAVQPDLNDFRWYPTMAPLPDGGMLTVGGGGLNNPERVRTAEVLDPDTMTWTPVDDAAIGNEVSPVVLLHTGEVLMTHRPPQLYAPATQGWRSSADFVQGDRMANGDHADHELAMLSDGRVVAIGFKSFTADFGNLVEVYDPIEDAWTLGASFAPVRSRASIVMLPDERLLVVGGFKEDADDPSPVNAWGQVFLTDLYDPAADAWRRLADLAIAREYHAMPILVPDGRVFVVGGEGQPGNEPDQSIVEVFSPPYLSRGPRPAISALSATTLQRGDTLSFTIARTNAPTRVVLVGASAQTHFMESGPGRYLSLAFTQQGDRVDAAIPTEPALAIPGYYLLFALVDDIPSEGILVRVAR
jgi:hypothetical protein